MAEGGREIDLSQFNIEQLTNIKSQHEQEIKEIMGNWKTLKEAESRFVSTKQGLDVISAKDGRSPIEMQISSNLA